MRNQEKLRLMGETDGVDQIAHSPGDSSLRLIKVEVTEKDCKEANPGRAMSCAVSLAMRRAFPGASYACTRHNRMTVTVARRYLHFQVNDRADRFIDHIDLGREPTPTTLVFRLVDVRKVPPSTPERKAQINAARNKRRDEGRPDKTYPRADPLRMRTMKDAKKANHENQAS